MDRTYYSENMRAKFSWMNRSYARMKENISYPIDVEDHFLSYLHASQLNWHYFGAYCSDLGLPKKEPQRLFSLWKDRTLAAAESNIWSVLNGLRNSDVHVRPVSASRISEPTTILFGGAEITYGGRRITYGDHCYQVALDGIDYDVIMLASSGLAVMGKFIEEFERGKIV